MTGGEMDQQGGSAQPNGGVQRIRRRRWPWIVTPVVAIVAIAGVVAAIVVPRTLARDEAARDLASIAALVPEHGERLETALAERGAADEALLALTGAVDAVLAAEVGERVAPETVAALRQARDAVPQAPAAGAVDVVAVAEAQGLDIDELRAETARIERANAESEAAAERAGVDAAVLHEAAEALTAASAAYAAALGESGAALLEERADAEEEPRAALQSVLDALPATETAGLAEQLTRFLESADALVASSDAVREAALVRERAAPAPRAPSASAPPHSTGGSVSAQIDYLLRHAYDYNTAEWGDYNPSGGDCANFVSQGLLQRGIPMDSTWRSGGPGQASTAWVYVPAMDRWLAGKGYERLGLDQLDRLKVGDVGIFDWEPNGSGNHTMTVSRIEQGADGPIVYFVSHNRDGEYRELRHVIEVEWPGANAWFYSIP
ncbi:amidase domain-containing protein [Arenivirga flava]|uniref:Putative amidase domain-containing protein n=1 Tax=Arenivirga flava TaxID=1930060 RepID=A0AA37UHS9_9MICO|nr:amidase domain-containing protein [Arenivirga flava]GMA29254.1 hypothetical protein GCM10025874_25070 [Arenivirga flava]